MGTGIFTAILISANVAVVLDFLFKLYSQHSLVPLGSEESLYRHIDKMDPRLSARYRLVEFYLLLLCGTIVAGIIYFVIVCENIKEDYWYMVIISLFSLYLFFVSRRHFFSLQGMYIMSTMNQKKKKF